MPQATVAIPNPCPKSWAAMTPTAKGRFCGACQTEVVDFTRLSTEEVLAYLAARPGQRVCGQMVAPVVGPVHQPKPRGPRAWLLALAALLGWQAAGSCVSKPPQAPPQVAAASPGVGQQQATIRGQVIDDSLNVPLAGAYVFIGGTPYGAITDAQGSFSLSFPIGWEPVRSGQIQLEVPDIPFKMNGTAVKVSLAATPEQVPVAIRLKSIPERGLRRGKAKLEEPPIPLSELGKKRR